MPLRESLGHALPWGLGLSARLSVGFGSVFVHTFVGVMVFNVVDLLLIDWSLFVRIRPRSVVLPGTEGAAGYDDYAFHSHAFLQGSAGIVVVSGIAAGAVSLLS